MRARLEELEAQSAQHQAVVDDLSGKYADTVERLQSDKARLEVSAKSPARSFHRIVSSAMHRSYIPTAMSRVEHRLGSIAAL